jgi:Rieske Fe-S protein
MSIRPPGLKIMLVVFGVGVILGASALWVWQAFQERPRPVTIPRALESFSPGVVAYFVIPGDETPVLRQLWQGKPPVESVGSIAFFLVNHETEGFLALYARDPYLGCFVQWQQASERFYNPCHGETYTKAGQCMFGPCPRSLDRFVLELREGELIVHLDRLMPGPPRLEPGQGTPTPAVPGPPR